jgi:hypothetical protein
VKNIGNLWMILYYDTSREGSVDVEFIGQPDIEEANSHNLHEYSEISIAYFQQNSLVNDSENFQFIKQINT